LTHSIHCRRHRFRYATLRLRIAIRRHHPHCGLLGAKSAASGSVRWCCFRSCWTVLSHVMRGRHSCLLQSAGGEANRIFLVSALSSMRIICPNRVSRRDHHSVQIGTTSVPMVECIDLTCVRLRYRLAVRAIQEYW